MPCRLVPLLRTTALLSILAVAPGAGAELRGPACRATPADLFAPGSSCDSNGDQVLGAADLIANHIDSTRPACGTGGTIALYIENGTDLPLVSVRLQGRRRQLDCDTDSLAQEYDWSVDCPGSAELPCISLNQLAPGDWVHSVEVLDPNTGQVQFRRGLVIGDGRAAVVRFTAFATVLTVDSTSNSGTGSFRNRLQLTTAAAKPVLVQFDEEVFPTGVPTRILLDSPLPTLSASQVTIDGLDSDGERGNRILDARGRAFGALSITGGNNRLIGLRLRGAGGNDRDVVNIAGASADGNLIDDCILETAGTADGLGVDQNAGSGFDETVNVLRDSEVFAAADKGVKVTTGAYLKVERSSVHDNANGGVQATLAGNVQVINSVIEDNRGASAQNGLSVQGAEGEASAAYLESVGNIVRRNGANGASVRAAVAVLEDSYFASNGSSGIRVFNDIGPAAEAVIEGTTAACNGVDGAVVANTSTADFGGGPLLSAGDNAFTQNNLPDGGANLRNGTASVVRAINNQWEHCGRLESCDDASIRGRDLSDSGVRTEIAPAQAHRAMTPPLIERVEPLHGRAGELVRVFGRGFNVIDGHFAEDECSDVGGRNRCVPLRGNCVRIGGVPATVEAVTPTMIIVRRPFTCLADANVTVTVDKGPTGLTSNAVTACASGPEE